MQQSLMLDMFAADDAAPVRTVHLSDGMTVTIKFLRGMPLEDVWATVDRNTQELEKLAERSLSGEDEPDEALITGSDLGPLETFAATIDDGSGDRDYLILAGEGTVTDGAGRTARNCLRAPTAAVVQGDSSVGDHLNVFVFP